mmetsp:Transcript_59351/g.109739  ORF Transcript_59351/g.109739 Transcript_59351/m.109739 type:complete len:225 (-) Transcript_59351:897-1571(-)
MCQTGMLTGKSSSRHAVIGMFPAAACLAAESNISMSPLKLFTACSSLAETRNSSAVSFMALLRPVVFGDIALFRGRCQSTAVLEWEAWIQTSSVAKMSLSCGLCDGTLWHKSAPASNFASGAWSTHASSTKITAVRFNAAVTPRVNNWSSGLNEPGFANIRAQATAANKAAGTKEPGPLPLASIATDFAPKRMHFCCTDFKPPSVKGRSVWKQTSTSTSLAAKP